MKITFRGIFSQPDFVLKVALAGFIFALAVAVTPARAAEAKPPMILIFDADAGTGANKTLSASTTKAVKMYFRETRRVETLIFDRESPTVQRAVIEKKLTSNAIASYSTRAEKISVASVLGFEYALGAEVSILKDIKSLVNSTISAPPKGMKVIEKPENEEAAPKQDYVVLKLWLARVDGKGEQWESTQNSVATASTPTALDNAMQSAASAAVLDLTRKAFAKLPQMAQTDASGGLETTATTPDQPVIAQPNATDLSMQADEELSDGNTAQAIQKYSAAVSADPSNIKLRCKLAEAYAHKGLFDQASKELDRAAAFGTDTALLDASKARVARMQSGENVTTAKKPKQKVDSEPTTKPSSNTAPPTAKSREGKAAVARLVQGDKLWNMGQPDEAVVAYTEAAKLNPSDWRAYERLAAVNASMSLFGEASKAIELLKAAQPTPPADTVNKRFEMFRRAFDTAFSQLLKQIASDTADFDQKIITRESYYATVGGIDVRLEMMSTFLDALTVPTIKQPANLRRSLACGLLSQATSSMKDYLETNNKTARKNADLFLAQAKKEFDAVANLDANKIVITSEPSRSDSGAAATNDQGEKPSM